MFGKKELNTNGSNISHKWHNQFCGIVNLLVVFVFKKKTQPCLDWI